MMKIFIMMVPHTIYFNIPNVEYGFILFYHCSGVNQIECGKDDSYEEYAGLQLENQMTTTSINLESLS